MSPAKKRARRAVKVRLPEDAAPVELPSATNAADRVREMIEDQIRRLNDPKQRITEAARVKALGGLVNAVAMLGRITGETLEITDAKLLKLPAFRRMQDVLVRALKPYPEAMRAAGAALQDFGRQQEG